MNHNEHLPAILGFLRAAGIVVNEETLPGESFLPGLRIRRGELVYDPARLLWPGDLLHEAGHLAVLPRALRQQADDDLKELPEAEFGGEQEALAWAYAAAMALGLPLEVLIHDGGYKGQAAALRQMYALGMYPGLQGLCGAGMAESPRFMQQCGPVHYPRMLRWLRD
jgi:hypothetical protein